MGEEEKVIRMRDWKEIVARGDVFGTDFSPPVVVIQNDIYNKFSPHVTVALITGTIQEAKLPTHLKIDAKQYGLERYSVILLDQIRTIDKSRLTEKITHLDDAIMDEVSERLVIQLGLEKLFNL